MRTGEQERGRGDGDGGRKDLEHPTDESLADGETPQEGPGTVTR